MGFLLSVATQSTAWCTGCGSCEIFTSSLIDVCFFSVHAPSICVSRFVYFYVDLPMVCALIDEACEHARLLHVYVCVVARRVLLLYLAANADSPCGWKWGGRLNI